MRSIRRTLLAIQAVIIAVLAYATFIEQAHGAAYATRHIYHTWWFCTLWGVLSVLSLAFIIGQRLYHRTAVFALHLSFLLILAGAAVTHLTSKEGKIHLRQGTTGNTYVEDHTQSALPLPFALSLERFEISYYPGTTAPSDFISHVAVTTPASPQQQHVVISMNNIHTTHGYRLYQSSFDPDKKGTTLTVNYDPWGTAVTYLGYAMMAFSMIAVLLSQREEFRRLLRHPALHQRLFFVLMAYALASPPVVHARSIPTINRQKAQQMARMQVVYNDRIAPLNTLATDFLQKIYGRHTYKGLSAEQVVYGWMARPDIWKQEKMIKVKQPSLRRQLGMADGVTYVSMEDLFNQQGNYRLAPLLQHSGSPLSRPIQELDEKVGLILMLSNGTLITPRPQETAELPRYLVEAELAYNAIPFSKILFMFNLTLGLLTFLLLIYRHVRPPGNINRRLPEKALRAGLYAAFAFHLTGYLLRWIISKRIPLGNGYETMLFLSLAVLTLTLLLYRRFPFILPFGFLLSGFTLLVSHLAQMSPQVTSLMPVLQSPLLSAHVSVIMTAYALLAFMMLNGILACLLSARKSSRQSDQRIAQLTVLSRLMLYPAVFLLGIGIFLGAVWANISWGKYWSWDPKEVWALITFMVYGLPFHRQSGLFSRPLCFHAYLAVAFLTVLMTYFGVNYFLGGMHSYA